MQTVAHVISVKSSQRYHQLRAVFTQLFKVMYVLWFRFTTLSNLFKNWPDYVSKSESKLKSIVARLQTFSRSLRRLHVFGLNFDWLTGLSMSFLIGQSDSLVLF